MKIPHHTMNTHSISTIDKGAWMKLWSCTAVRLKTKVEGKKKTSYFKDLKYTSIRFFGLNHSLENEEP